MKKCKIAALFVLTTSLFSFFIFWNSLSTFCLEKGVNVYCQRNFGRSLVFERLSCNEKGWVFECPELHQEDVILSAQKLLIDVSPHFLERTLYVNIALQGATVTVAEGVTNLKEVVQNLVYKSFPLWLLKVNTHFSVEDGRIEWNERTVEGSSPRTTLYTLQVSSKGEHRQAQLNLSLTPEASDMDLFTLNCSKDGENPFFADLTFREVYCQRLVQLACILGHSFDGWEVDEGMVNGFVSYRQPEEDRGYLWGEAKGDHLCFYNKQQGLECSLERVALDLGSYLGGKKIPTLAGHILFEGNNKIEWERQGEPAWIFEALEGKVHFLAESGIELSLKGESKHPDHPFLFSIDGNADVFGQSQASLDLLCSVSAPYRKKSTFAISAQQLAASYSSAQIDIKDMGKEEFSLLQTFLSPVLNNFSDLSFRDGRLNARATAFFHRYALNRLRIDELEGERLKVDWLPLNLTVEIERVVGEASVDLEASSPMDSLQGTLSLVDSRLALSQSGSALFECQEVNTNINLLEGVLQKSKIEGNFAGMEGTLEVDWLSSDEFLKVNLQGVTDSLFSFFPDPIATPLEKVLKGEALQLSGGMVWNGHAAHFDGEAILNHQKVGESKTVAIAFDLESSQQLFFEEYSDKTKILAFWEEMGYQTLSRVVPPIITPSLLFATNWINAEMGVVGLVIRRGTFETKDIPLEQYLSPILFPNGKLHLRGKGAFKGAFDHKSVSVEYDASELSLENEHLIITVPKISSKGRSLSAHYFDLHQGSHYGVIEVVDGTYLEKVGGYFYEGVSGVVTFLDDRLLVDQLKVQAFGLKGKGALELAYGSSLEENFSLSIDLQKVEGPYAGLQALLQSYVPYFKASPLPLDGKVSLKDTPARLNFKFFDDHYTFNTKVSATLEEGVLSLPYSKGKLVNLKAHVLYDDVNDLLQLSQISGKLISSENTKEKESLFLSGDSIRFDALSKGECVFDCWVGDQKSDLIRFVGSLKEGESGDLDFFIDKEQTHVGQMHFDQFLCSFRNGNLQNLDAKWSSSIPATVPLLRRLSLVGALPMSQKILDLLNGVKKSEGILQVSLLWDQEESSLRYVGIGEDVSFNETAFEQWKFQGKKKEDSWMVEEFQFNQFQGSGACEYCGDEIHVTNGKLSIGSAVSTEFTLTSAIETGEVTGEIEALKIALESAEDLSFISDAFSLNTPISGDVFGKGTIQATLSTPSSPFTFDLLLDLKSEQMRIGDKHLEPIEEVVCRMHSDKGVALKNMKIKLPSLGLDFSVEDLGLSFDGERVTVEDLYFSVKPKRLPQLVSAFSEWFQVELPIEVCEKIYALKQEEDLSGRFQFEWSAPYYALRLDLDDGFYHVLGEEYLLKGLKIEYDPFEFRAESLYRLGSKDLLFTLFSSSPTGAFGDLIVRESDCVEKALIAHWTRDLEGNWRVKSAKGEVSGIGVHLHEDPKVEKFLGGEMSINFRKAKALCSASLSQFLERWKFGDGYRLKGKWGYDFDSATPFHFFGVMEADAFCFNGWCLDHLAAHVEIGPQNIRIRDFSLEDAAFTLQSEAIDLVKNTREQWTCALEALRVEAFRPSLLKEEGGVRPTKRQPFVVKAFELNQFSGILEEPNSFRGEGILHFTNRPKRLRKNTLFQIPAEILTRLGLDSSILTPVNGTVRYAVDNGRFELLEFKDIYSNNKLSKFYLSSTTPSFVDFDGGLNVHVRMKHHTILLKIAELFTLKVKGTLSEPSYSITKSHRTETASAR